MENRMGERLLTTDDQSKPGTKRPQAETRLGDLCESCRSASVCVFFTSDRDPVLHCPNYQGLDANVSGARIAEVSEGPVSAKTVDPEGLCSRCSIAATCTKERPPGGVWQCEDFS